MNTSKLLGLIYGAFIGDALALGPHWIYNIEDIKEHYQPITGYTSPNHTPYHSNKKAGDFTHYGDQTLLLLESISKNKGFDIESFKHGWLHFMTHAETYLDHASKISIPLLSETLIYEGSNSDELGGFVRSAPLFLIHASKDDFKKQIALTHNNPYVFEISDYFVEVVNSLLEGVTLNISLETALVGQPDRIVQSYRHAKEQTGSLIESVLAIGQSCSSQYGLPSVLSILLKAHEQDLNFKETLIENTYAGGDSASRGILIGMLLGASIGIENIPKDLIEGLNKQKQIQQALSTLGF